MGHISSLLACLGCIDKPPASAKNNSPAPKQGNTPESKQQDPKSAPNKRDSIHQHRTPQPSPRKQRSPHVSLSRQSSRQKLTNLPLEYVQDPDDDPEDSIIIGRKASYSLGDTHSSSRSTSRANSSSNLLGLIGDQDSQSTIMPDQIDGYEVRLLGKQPRKIRGRKTLVLDLDETLVHSSFKYMPNANFIIPVEIDGQVHNVYVAKRPGVDEFLKQVGEIFEVVVFTASVAKYGDPLLDHLDIHHVIHHRLFREACYNLNSSYIKNLSQLGRPLEDTIIIDNSPASYALQPQNAVPVSSWFSDIHDNELLAMLPFLSALAEPTVRDVCMVLDVYIGE